MAHLRASALSRPVASDRDHILGEAGAAITLVEYGSYACPYCHAAHEIIADLRDRFGGSMRYVFRHLPIAGSEEAKTAAVLAEHASETTDRFWEVHDALMKRGPVFTDRDFEELATEFELPSREDASPEQLQAAERRVREDAGSARSSGALVTPTFFINGRRYEGPWDENALAEAMLGSLGHRLQAATLDFVRWGPSVGLLLLLMSLLAIVVANSSAGPAFEAWWRMPLGLQVGSMIFSLPLISWVNDGLLTIFFLVVGLEIKREFTVGRLATRRAAALPIAASLGGMVFPALIYIATVGTGPLIHGWGIPIATDTAFAVALIALLGDRVPVELRVFLTAAVVVDDLMAIAILALFYSGDIHLIYLAAAVAVIVGLVVLNRGGIYNAVPYAVLGVLLWVFLHHSGLHATMAGVILAVATPTRPPGNLNALRAQAEMVIRAETLSADEAVLRHGPSEPALRTLDAIHSRIESPASKLLRTAEPWSSYAILPVFALANAGVLWSVGIIMEHQWLMLAIVLGLVVGKPAGITLIAWLAVRTGLAVKPAAYPWRQLFGAGALAGIGFTMSLFIAGQAFPDSDNFAAAKMAIFLASLLAGALGVLILWPRATVEESQSRTAHALEGSPASGVRPGT